MSGATPGQFIGEGEARPPVRHAVRDAQHRTRPPADSGGWVSLHQAMTLAGLIGVASLKFDLASRSASSKR